MMRKIIGKILDTVLPPKGEDTASKEAPPPPAEVKTVSLEQLLGGAMGEPPAEARPKSYRSILFSRR